MAKTDPQSEDPVTDYINMLDHPLKNVVQELRKIILSADKDIGEQIKWNSPAFYYTGEMKSFDPKDYKRDIVVFNLHKRDYVLLVFPTGATVKDLSGLLEGKFADLRKISKFASIEEVKNRKSDLVTVLKSWLKKVEK